MTDEELLASYGVDTTPFSEVGMLPIATVIAMGWQYWAEVSPLLLYAAIGASPPFIALGWSVWEYVHPLLIPQIEIDSLAADYVGRYGDDAAYEVTVEMERAAFRGETAEAGAFRRVLKAVEGIQERLKDGPSPGSLRSPSSPASGRG